MSFVAYGGDSLDDGFIGCGALDCGCACGQINGGLLYPVHCLDGFEDIGTTMITHHAIDLEERGTSRSSCRLMVEERETSQDKGMKKQAGKDDAATHVEKGRACMAACAGLHQMRNEPFARKKIVNTEPEDDGSQGD